MKDVHYLFCTEEKNLVCVSRADAKAEIANKIALGTYIREQNAIIDYYESMAKTDNRPAPSPDN